MHKKHSDSTAEILALSSQSSSKKKKKPALTGFFIGTSPTQCRPLPISDNFPGPLMNQYLTSLPPTCLWCPHPCQNLHCPLEIAVFQNNNPLLPSLGSQPRAPLLPGCQEVFTSSQASTFISQTNFSQDVFEPHSQQKENMSQRVTVTPSQSRSVCTSFRGCFLVALLTSRDSGQHPQH